MRSAGSDGWLLGSPPACPSFQHRPCLFRLPQMCPVGAAVENPDLDPRNCRGLMGANACDAHLQAFARYPWPHDPWSVCASLCDARHCRRSAGAQVCESAMQVALVPLPGVALSCAPPKLRGGVALVAMHEHWVLLHLRLRVPFWDLHFFFCPLPCC